jgi:hypothetical protein
MSSFLFKTEQIGNTTLAHPKPYSKPAKEKFINSIHTQENSLNPAVKEGEILVHKHASTHNGQNFVISQGRLEQWCADTVNYLYLKAFGKDPFGVDKKGNYINSDVKSLKNWGIQHKRFHTASGAEKIQAQFKSMKPGDVIIFKSPFVSELNDGKKIVRHASHTGIIKNVSKGVVTTIEGNANVYRTNKKGERYLVHNLKEGENGNQSIGDFQEVNKYDGVIEKRYKVQDLINHGYSGYIDMKNAVVAKQKSYR